MIDGQVELQAAIVAAGRADPGVSGFVADRIFDAVPTNPQGQPSGTFPYTSFGRFETAGVGGQCDTGVEIDVQIDSWSRAVGSIEAKQIGAAWLRLLMSPFDVDGFEVTIAELLSLGTQRGLDGLTTQSVLRMRFSLSPKS